MDLQELALNVYNTNKANGFWDEERDKEECMALINSELYEALEAHRKGKFAKVELYNYCIKASEDKEHFIQCFKLFIKDTIEDELADTVIRTLDFICGFIEIGIAERLKEKTSFKQCVRFCHFSEEVPSNFGAFVLRLSGFICLDSLSWPLKTIGSIAKYCEEKNIDLDFHVREKLRFNKTRERMHGKKY